MLSSLREIFKVFRVNFLVYVMKRLHYFPFWLFHLMLDWGQWFNILTRWPRRDLGYFFTLHFVFWLGHLLVLTKVGERMFVLPSSQLLSKFFTLGVHLKYRGIFRLAVCPSLMLLKFSWVCHRLLTLSAHIH